MTVKTKRAIVHPDKVLANVGEMFTVTNKYHSYGTDWYDVENERTKINVQAQHFNYFFEEV